MQTFVFRFFFVLSTLFVAGPLAANTPECGVFTGSTWLDLSKSQSGFATVAFPTLSVSEPTVWGFNICGRQTIRVGGYGYCRSVSAFLGRYGRPGLPVCAFSYYTHRSEWSWNKTSKTAFATFTNSYRRLRVEVVCRNSDHLIPVSYDPRYPPVLKLGWSGMCADNYLMWILVGVAVTLILAACAALTAYLFWRHRKGDKTPSVGDDDPPPAEEVENVLQRMPRPGNDGVVEMQETDRRDVVAYSAPPSDRPSLAAAGHAGRRSAGRHAAAGHTAGWHSDDDHVPPGGDDVIPIDIASDHQTEFCAVNETNDIHIVFNDFGDDRTSSDPPEQSGGKVDGTAADVERPASPSLTRNHNSDDAVDDLDTDVEPPSEGCDTDSSDVALSSKSQEQPRS